MSSEKQTVSPTWVLPWVWCRSILKPSDGSRETAVCSRCEICMNAWCSSSTNWTREHRSVEKPQDLKERDGAHVWSHFRKTHVCCCCFSLQRLFFWMVLSLTLSNCHGTNVTVDAENVFDVLKSCLLGCALFIVYVDEIRRERQCASINVWITLNLFLLIFLFFYTLSLWMNVSAKWKWINASKKYSEILVVL